MDFVSKYKNIRMIGGCCGTNPEHIAELKKAFDLIKR
jgi:5-methyltetrahydrofolate--homocysteine methyltransferase